MVIFHHHLVMTDIAMENGPFIDGLPILNGDFPSPSGYITNSSPWKDPPIYNRKHSGVTIEILTQYFIYLPSGYD